MAQITSREELEAWLKDKPADWARVIAARAALRALPYAFKMPIRTLWVEKFAVSLFRAGVIFCAMGEFSAHPIRAAAAAAAVATRASDNYMLNNGAAFSIAYTASSYRIDHPTSDHFLATAASDYVRDYASRAADAAADAADRSARDASVLASISNPLTYDADVAQMAESRAGALSHAAIWASIEHDSRSLTKFLHSDLAGAAHHVTGSRLWQTSEGTVWRDAWQFATTRLLTLDPTYQVWIDWYNRRIEGHDAAFDIPGDSNRTEDKAILARLADATNEDFWDKGATYVNTTLQRWIDEAREQAAIDYVASGAPLNLGSDAELAARDELASRLASVEAALAALKDQLASLTQTGHGGIGHNQPENAGSLRDDEIITLKQQVKELETLVTGANAALTQPEPDIGELVQLVPKLNRWGRAMQVVEDATSAKVRDGLETWAGPAALGAVGYLASTTIPNALAAFSHYFYTYWIPILMG
jgi:hypothetical protein